MIGNSWKPTGGVSRAAKASWAAALLMVANCFGLSHAQTTIDYIVNGQATKLEQVSDMVALRYRGKLSTQSASRQMVADAKAAGWNVVFGDPALGISVVRNDPTTVRRTAADNSDVFAATYPVFRIPGTSGALVATDELLVKFSASADSANLFAKHNLATLRPAGGGALVVRAQVSGRELIELAAELSAQPGVEFAEPNWLMRLQRSAINPLPNDPYYSKQWHLEHTVLNTIGAQSNPNVDLDAARFWNLTSPSLEATKGEGIIVAVIDDGVEAGHEDFFEYDANGQPIASRVLTGFDFMTLDDDASPELVDGHGTACAGLIGAVQNNGRGISGVAPAVKILPVRIFQTLSSGQTAAASSERIGNAIRFAADRGADILSNSWGGGADSSFIRDAVRHAFLNGRNGLGCTILFASGNEYGGISFPAAYSSSQLDPTAEGLVISVGAISDRGERVSYSNAGPNLTLVAPSMDVLTSALAGTADRTGMWTMDRSGVLGDNPGSTITSTFKGDPEGNYTSEFNGTSAACPVAAGAAALVLARQPNLTAAQLRRKLIDYAATPGDPARWVDPTRLDSLIVDETNPCLLNIRNFDLGWGLINPWRSNQQLLKRFPFRNTWITYDVDFELDGALGWLPVQGNNKIVCSYPSANRFVFQNQWTNIEGIGWVETRPNFTCDCKTFPENNEKGYYSGGVNQWLISPIINLVPNQHYSMAVLDHRFSMGIEDSGTGQPAFDIATVKVAYDDQVRKIIAIAAGTQVEFWDVTEDAKRAEDGSITEPGNSLQIGTYKLPSASTDIGTVQGSSLRLYTKNDGLVYIPMGRIGTDVVSIGNVSAPAELVRITGGAPATATDPPYLHRNLAIGPAGQMFVGGGDDGVAKIHPCSDKLYEPVKAKTTPREFIIDGCFAIMACGPEGLTRLPAFEDCKTALETTGTDAGGGSFDCIVEAETTYYVAVNDTETTDGEVSQIWGIDPRDFADDPATPPTIRVTTGGPISQLVFGEIAAGKVVLAATSVGLEVYSFPLGDAVTPLATAVDEISPDNEAKAILIVDNSAFVSYGSGIVREWDLTDPTAPSMLRSFDVAGQGGGRMVSLVFVEDTNWQTVQYYRGHSGESPSYGSEAGSLQTRHTIPLGDTFGKKKVAFAMQFKSRDSYQATGDNNLFGWALKKFRLIQYDLNDRDYRPTNIDGFRPDWAADGKSIFFVEAFSGRNIINQPADQYRALESGGLCTPAAPAPTPRSNLTLAIPDAQVLGLDVIPNSNRIAISHNNNSNSSPAVQAISDDGLDARSITGTLKYTARDIRYSTDGRQLCFTDNSKLYTVPADSATEPREVKINYNNNTPLYRISDPVFALNNARILFAASTEQFGTRDLFLVHLTTGETRKVVDWPNTDESQPDIATSGTLMVFVSNAVTTGNSGQPAEYTPTPSPTPTASETPTPEPTADPGGGEPGRPAAERGTEALDRQTLAAISPEAGTVTRLFVLKNFDKAVTNKSVEPIFEDIAPPTTNEGPFAYPRFSPDGTAIVYNFGRTIRIRRLDRFGENLQNPANSQPTPSPTPTASPSASPTVSPSPSPTPIQFAFGLLDFGGNNNDYGWKLVEVPPFDAPAYSGQSTLGLALTSPNSQNTFGYLESQPAFINGTTSDLILLRWKVNAAASAASAIPKFRMRNNTSDLQDANLLEVESLGDNSMVPVISTTSSTSYNQILELANGKESSAAFDLLSIDPANDSNAIVRLRRLEVYRIPKANLSEKGTARVFNFDSDSEGWVGAGFGGPFSVPTFTAANGALIIEATDNNLCGGNWSIAPVTVDTTTSAQRMLKIEWKVYLSNLSDPLTAPGFRTRAFTTDFQYGVTRHITSKAPGDLLPSAAGAANAVTYTQYLTPVTGNLTLGFDVLNFDSSDAPKGRVCLESVRLVPVEVNGFPSP